MKNSYNIILLIFLVSLNSYAQQIKAQVVDHLTGEVLPYATVTFSDKKGTISNEEGVFEFFNDGYTNVSINSMGYASEQLPISDLDGKIIRLKPLVVSLNEVFISNKNLTAKEIMQRVITRIDSNYNFGLTQKRFFFRKSEVNYVNNFDLHIDKSTIPELNQSLMDSVSNSIPKLTDSYKEVLGNFYGNYDQQKIKVLKAANLHDPNSSGSADLLAERIESIFKKNVKKDSYFKIRTGIIGFRVDADEFSEDFSEKETEEEKLLRETIEAREKRLASERNNLHKSITSKIGSLIRTNFWKEDQTFNLFEKTGKYNFEIAGYTLYNGEPAYILNFEPKRKRSADFSGQLIVNTTDFGIYQVDYANVNPLKRFRLFGISHADDLYRGKMIFNRDASGLYNPQYLERETGESFSLKRPLTIIEKNKYVKGRRKQNELDLDLFFKMKQTEKLQLVIYESSSLQQDDFALLKPQNDFYYQKFNKYNPEFWQGENIIAPNEAIQAFENYDSNSD